VIEEQRSDLPALLRYAEAVCTLPPDKLQQVYVHAEKGVRQEPSSAARIRLALLLSRRDAPFFDESRARSLLQAAADPGAGTNGDSESASLARLLLAMLDDRARMREERDRTEQALASERKARATLQRQLDELKAIEQKLNDRERSTEIPIR
jgi:hypothetical protein